MDEKDFEILKILDKNCRISYSNIAKSVNLPLRNISTRIENLLKSNIIRRFTVQFNYNSLGFRHYIGSINSIKKQQNENLFEELQKIPEIYRIWEILDRSFTISFFCKNAKHLEEFITNILKIGVKLNDFKETRIHFPLDIPYSLTDWQLIFFMMNNSRVSKKEIAEALELSEKTVKRRLTRMENMKLIQFVPEINYEAITGMHTGVLSLRTIGPSKQIYLKIKEDKSIKFWRNAGSVSPSIVLFVYGKSLTELYEMYLKLEKRNGIKQARLVFVVRNIINSTLIEDAILEKIQSY